MWYDGVGAWYAVASDWHGYFDGWGVFWLVYLYWCDVAS